MTLQAHFVHYREHEVLFSIKLLLPIPPPLPQKRRKDDPFSVYPSSSLLVFLGDEHNAH